MPWHGGNASSGSAIPLARSIALVLLTRSSRLARAATCIRIFALVINHWRQFFFFLPSFSPSFFLSIFHWPQGFQISSLLCKHSKKLIEQTEEKEEKKSKKKRDKEEVMN